MYEFITYDKNVFLLEYHDRFFFISISKNSNLAFMDGWSLKPAQVVKVCLRDLEMEIQKIAQTFLSYLTTSYIGKRMQFGH